MSRWQELKNLYDTQKYQNALQVLQAEPNDSAIYYYNLGTIYARLDRPGLGLAYLEKAKRLNPSDPDIQYNLSWVQSKLSQLIGEDRLDPTSSSIEQSIEIFQYPKIQFTLSIFTLIFGILWIRVYLSKRNLKQAIREPLGTLSLLGMTLIGIVLGMCRWSNSQPIAVCIEKTAIRSGPGNHFIELSRADEGTKLRLLGPEVQAHAETTPSSPSTAQSSPKELELWRQVRYSQEGVGWIRASGLLVL